MPWRKSGKAGLNNWMMYRKLDIENWERKAHFEFFRQFEEPFYGTCVQVDMTRLVSSCKSSGESVFLRYLHAMNRAVNSVENLRMRLQDGKVLVYDCINVSATIGRVDKTFDFSFIPFDEDFSVFQASAQKEISRVRSSKGLNPGVAGADVVHYSSLPWLDFTSMSHARAFGIEDSCPKITFGKISPDGAGYRMPVSIHVHHALVDGYHIGILVENFQKFINEV